MSEQRKPETVIMEDEPTHTAQNGYECDDPKCICHAAQQAMREALDRPGKAVSKGSRTRAALQDQRAQSVGEWAQTATCLRFVCCVKVDRGEVIPAPKRAATHTSGV